MRGIFALMIVVLHSSVDYHFLNAPLIRNAFYFVDYFFVLSGFVVSLAYTDRLTNLSSAVDFVILRIGRLWPLHAFVAFSFLAYMLLKSVMVQVGVFGANPTPVDEELLAQVGRDLLFLNAFVNTSWLTLNFPAWSINAEFWAYLVFGTLCILVVPVRFTAAIVALLCLTVLAGWVEPAFGANFGWAPFRAIFLFLSGYYAFLAYSRVKHSRLPFPSLVEAALVLAIIVTMSLSASTPGVSFVLDALFIISIVVFALQRGVFSRLLQKKFFQLLGVRSYSIYITHIFVLSVLGTTIRAIEKIAGVSLYQTGLVGDIEHNLLSFGPIWMMDLYLLVQLVLVVWLAGLTYRYIEVPGQTFAKRIVRSRNTKFRAD